jgi:hypothetical protein
LEEKRREDRTDEKSEDPEPRADENIRVGRLEINQNTVDSDGGHNLGKTPANKTESHDDVFPN